jgi:signal transduction histidine kinase
MHERAKAVGGDLQLISAPGAGTRVLLTVPATAAIGSSR